MPDRTVEIESITPTSSYPDMSDVTYVLMPGPHKVTITVNNTCIQNRDNLELTRSGWRLVEGDIAGSVSYKEWVTAAREQMHEQDEEPKLKPRRDLHLWGDEDWLRRHSEALPNVPEGRTDTATCPPPYAHLTLVSV